MRCLELVLCLSLFSFTAACSTASAPPGAVVVADDGASVISLSAGVARVRVLAIGTVAVKECHRELCVPTETPVQERIGAIFGPGEFTPAMPILSYLVEHPEGTFVVDAGELSRFNDDPDYYACAPEAGALDQNLLRVTIEPGGELGPQLTRLGIDPTSLEGVILTHLHADHTGGVPQVGRSPVFVSGVDYDLGPMIGGAVCRSLDPVRSDLRRVEMLYENRDDEVDRVFGASVRLTSDGAVRIVPTPGHTPGALSLLVRGEEVDLLFVGDAAFDLDMVAERRLAGINISLVDALASYDRIVEYTRLRPTIVLPAHDPSARARLESAQLTRL
jgi:N-acyl homoserine lactone hydrolase